MLQESARSAWKFIRWLSLGKAAEEERIDISGLGIGGESGSRMVGLDLMRKIREEWSFALRGQNRLRGREKR